MNLEEMRELQDLNARTNLQALRGIKAMLTIKELAEKLRVHDRTVRRWIKQGKIQVIKVDRTIRISDEEYNRLTGGKNEKG